MKAKLRDEARATRRAIAQRDVLSERIALHAMTLPEVAPGRAAGCYAAMGSEVSTTLLMRALFAKGLTVAVPVTHGDAMRFVALAHPWALVAAERGPPLPRQPWTDVASGSLDIIFVPGLQFGRDGSRLGQGGGHFDRFLAEHPRPTRIGLAFSAQVVDTVAAREPHDEAMDILVTEDGVVRVGEREGRA